MYKITAFLKFFYLFVRQSDGEIFLPQGHCPNGHISQNMNESLSVLVTSEWWLEEKLIHKTLDYGFV